LLSSSIGISSGLSPRTTTMRGTSRAASAALAAQRPICIRSSAGAPYSASKAAVNAYSASLALEVAPFGVRVHLVLPGRSPERTFGEYARQHLRGAGHADYGALVERIIGAMREAAGPVTHAEDVALAIRRAVTDASAP
jgi:NAD(P)-dependent dehydrogenase (short-subunit alcohol dehydrogenase family)